MKLKLISFLTRRIDGLETCDNCGFDSYIDYYELMVEVVSSEKQKVGNRHAIRFEGSRYIDKYMVNDEQLWREFLDQNEVPECESFDENWTYYLRKQYQCTMRSENEKKIAEFISNLIFGGRN